MKTEIERFSPCEDALAFRKKYKTFRGAWNNCPRGDWMLWIAYRLGVDLRTMTLAKGYCAKTVMHLMTDQRSKDAVKAAIDFGRGKIGRDELDKAADDAYYAADAYSADDASAAAYAAYSAADAAAAAYAADAAAAAAKKATANICRKYLTKAVMQKIKLLKP